MPNLGFSENLLILVIALLVFGAKRLPEMGASMGKGIREFKRSLKEIDDDSSSASMPQSRGQLDAAPSSGGEPKKLSQ
jgi:sec-independent protein translocase protein TatA